MTRLSRRSVLALVSSVPLLGIASRDAVAADDSYVEEDGSTVTIGNGLIELSFGRSNGGLRQVRSVQHDLNLQGAVEAGDATTWAMAVDHPGTETLVAPRRNPDTISTNSTEDAEVTISTDQTETEARITIEWVDPELFPNDVRNRFHGRVTVSVTVRAGDPLSSWEMAVENDTDLAITQFTCPNITGVTSIGDGDEVVLPTYLGRRYNDPVRLLNETDEIVESRYPSGFGTMQFTAFTGPSGGFYADARDVDGHVKRLQWARSTTVEDRLGFKFHHQSTLVSGADFRVPYPVTLGALDGDWYDAADRYRAWVDSTGWLDGATLPDWLLDLGATYRINAYPPSEEDPTYEFDLVADLTREMASFLGVPTQLQLDGWMTEREAGSSAPIEGWDSFASALDEVTSAGIRVSTLVGGNDKESDAPVFEENPDATDWIARGPTGEPISQGGEAEDYLIDSTHEGWQRYIRSFIRRIRDHGMTEVHYDGFPWVLLECHAASHDHEPGYGGNWWASRSREDIRRLQALMRERESGALSGEGIADVFLPYLDVHNSRDVYAENDQGKHVESGFTEIIPMFPYTFGDVVVTRNQNHSGINPPYPGGVSYLQSARALLWGALPILRHDDPEPATPERNEVTPELRYGRRVARARATYAHRFLARGRMLREPRLSVPSVRLSLGDVESDTRSVETAAVQASAWQSPIGEVGLLFTNVTAGAVPEPVDVTLDLATQPFAVPDGPVDRYIIRDERYERLESGDSLAVSVAPAEVLLVVVAPANPARIRALNSIIEAQEKVAGDLEAAKRAFETHDFESAMQEAQEALDAGPKDRQSTTESNDGSTTELNGGTPTGSSGGSTETESPGFGIVAALAGLAGAVAARFASDQRDE